MTDNRISVIGTYNSQCTCYLHSIGCVYVYGLMNIFFGVITIIIR